MSPVEHELIYWVMIGGAYVIFWWLTLFILLPIGMYDEDDMPGQFVPGAPPKPKTTDKRRPSLLSKALTATWVAAILWAIFYGLVLTGVIQA